MTKDQLTVSGEPMCMVLNCATARGLFVYWVVGGWELGPATPLTAASW